MAPKLYQFLQQLRNQVLAGEHDYRALEQQTKQQLTDAGFKPDYIDISDRNDLTLAQSASQEKVILAAAWLGTTRLIDNLEI